MKQTMKTALGAALSLALILGLTGCGASVSAAAPAAEGAAVITVSASGSVRLVPDKASVSFGVTTQAASAEEAQRLNGESVDRVIAVLTGRGVEEKSIRTSGYSLYPQYDWSEGGEQRIIGYNVTTSLSVQDRLCSGYDEAYRQALAQAVAAAKDKAEALAAAAGKKLGEPVSVTEGWQDSSARYNRAGGFELAKADAAAAMPDFRPGESEITANVTVSYQMK